MRVDARLAPLFFVRFAFSPVRLVLGSASPARLGVLRAAGVDPTVLVSDVDEDALLAELSDASPAEKVTALALAKARAVSAQVPRDDEEAVVIGCDSMLDLDGELVGKPHTVEATVARWRAQAGKTAELLTGHCIIRGAERVVDTATTRVFFAEATDADVAATKVVTARFFAEHLLPQVHGLVAPVKAGKADLFALTADQL